MKRIKNIMNNEKNRGLRFVVHVKNKEELSDLISALVDSGCSIEFTPEEITLAEWMEKVAAETNYDTCFRINENRLVAYNPSIEHWRVYCADIDILELRDGSLVYHEREGYTEESARIEAKKILDEREAGGNFVLQNYFVTENSTEDAIVEWLLRQSEEED